MRAFVKKIFEEELARWQELINDLAAEKLAHALQREARR
jgi:hypothetical protein